MDTLIEKRPSWFKRINIATALVAALLGSLAALVGFMPFVNTYITRTVDERITYRFRPADKVDEAYGDFNADQDADGFNALHDAIVDYRQRNVPGERQALENAVHSYLYYVSARKHQKLHTVEFAFITTTMSELAISQSRRDKMSIAWYHLLTGDVADAKKDYEVVISESEDDAEALADAYNGCMCCELINGEVEAADEDWKKAAKFNSDYSWFALDSNGLWTGPLLKEYGERFRINSRKLIEVVRQSGQTRSGSESLSKP